MPSGMVTSRCTGRPCCSRFRIAVGAEPRRNAGIRPPGSDRTTPNSARQARKLPELPRIAPASSSCPATRARLEPWATMIVFGSEVGPDRPRTARRRCRPPGSPAPAATSSKAHASWRRMARLDRLHHQAGVGAAEAEAVVEHGANLPLLGDCAAPGRRRRVPSLGFSRLSVGGTIWSRSARMQKIASTAPAPPSRWPIADLVELIETSPIALPNSRRTAPSSSLVAERRRGAVGVDIVDVDRVHARPSSAPSPSSDRRPSLRDAAR